MAEEEEQQAGPSSPSRSGTKLFLGGLSWETTEERVRNHFQRFGAIQEVIVMRDAITKKPRGFGFITFSDPESAVAVSNDRHFLDSRQIEVKDAVPQEQKPKSKKIFVGGLAPETTEEQFREYFKEFGTIADAQIMQDHISTRSRGFGFITFEDDSAVERVLAKGNMHDITGKRVEVKHATPRHSGANTRTPGGGRIFPRPPVREPIPIPGVLPPYVPYPIYPYPPHPYNYFVPFPYAHAYPHSYPAHPPSQFADPAQQAIQRIGQANLAAPRSFIPHTPQYRPPDRHFPPSSLHRPPPRERDRQ